MQTLNTPNKMVNLNTETKLKVTQEIHGFAPGQVVNYGHQPSKTQLLLRRRLADGDGSVEIVKAVTEKARPAISNNKSNTPHPGSKGSGKQNQGDK